MSTVSRRKAELSAEEKRALLAQLLQRRAAQPKTFPLSFAQQRLWFLDQLQPGSAAYTIPIAVWIDGALDIVALARGLGEVVRRHAALRTTFALEDGQPVQVAAPPSPTPLPLIDLGGLPPDEREAAARRLAAHAARRSFDLARGPLLVARLLCLDRERHVLVLAMHHIISDGWSMDVLIRELRALYGAFTAGGRGSRGEVASPLPPLPIQYADFAVWQRRRLQGEGEHAGSPLQALLAYWKGRLGQAPPALDLPADHPRRPIASAPGARHALLVPRPLADSLAALGQRAGATLFMTLLATFKVLLGRYTSQKDIVVGTPIANRERSELEGLIGCFVNTLVLRSDLSGDPSFLELLGRVREVCLDAYAHQELPFELLVEALRPVRDLGRTPLFQIMFDMQNTPAPSAEPHGLALRPLPIESPYTAFDLTLSVTETSAGLSLTFQYDAGLFEPATITRMAAHYQMLLEGVAADPHRRLSRLALLTEAERRQLLIEWNAARGVRGQGSGIRSTRLHKRHVCLPQRHEGTKLPKHARIFVSSRLRGWYLKGSRGRRTNAASELLTSDSWLLTSVFEAQAERTPDTVAIAFDETKDADPAFSVQRSAFSVQLTYRVLDRHANRLAWHLRRLGAGLEMRVAICLERSPELAIALLGVLKAGASYVPLDPAYPPERIAFMLEDAHIHVLLMRGGEAGGCRLEAGIESPVSSLQSPVSRTVVDLRAGWPSIEQQPETRPESGVVPTNLACVIYTSGSTGRPKGVLLAHRGLCGRVYWGLAASELTMADRCLQITSPSFDVAIVELFEPLAAGGQVVMARSGGQRDSAYLARFIAEQRVTVCNVVPSMLQLLLEEPGLARCRDLRHVFCGAEELPVELAERFFARSRAALHNIYGPTETSVDATCWDCAPAADRRTVPIGRPIAGASVYILDAHMQPAPIGVPGELYISGAGVARGYLGRPDLTAERFVPNPFARVSGIGSQVSEDIAPNTRHPIPDTQLYKTGDLARWRLDGELEYLGRIDGQVKIRGLRIELGEIEAALCQHPAVRAAAVLAREDVPGDKRLVAYVVPTNDQRTGTINRAPTTNDQRSEDKETRRQGEEAASSLLVSLSPPLISQAPSIMRSLRDYLKQKLPEYMLPSAFVALDALPLTPNGKLDRRALPPPARQADGVAPRGEIEQALARIWQELLDVEQVSVEENFFDLGGHSLLLVQLQGRLRELLGREVPIIELFQHPTIARLAAHLSPARHEQPASGDASAPRPAATPRTADIAIVGMAGRFPGARDVEQFWQNLRDGVESISFFSDEELAAAGVAPALLRQPNYVRAKGLLDDVELFDAGFFGYNPREAELIDPQQRIFLECAWEALERAGYDTERYAGRIGMFAGSSLNSYWFNLYTNADLVESAGSFQTVLGVDPDYLATRASYKLNLTGPSLAVQSACSTSLVATVLACRSLLDDDCDMALAGGVSVTVPLREGYLYQEGGVFSPDGHCRAFDADARGTVGGNGVGIVVLKRLEDALAEGDTIYALIKGAALNNDGAAKVGYTAPSVAGQSQVITQALTLAGIDPASIGYVEAHGTGTPLGDPIEVTALSQVFRASTEATQFCALGSVKSNVGHLDAAAGVAGLIKAVLSLQHGQIPPSLHFTTPNPLLELERSPFYVNTHLRAMPQADHPRRAAVSSFGIGGTNAHVVLEQAPELPAAEEARPWQLLLLSARSPGALEQATANLAAYLRREPSLELADVAYTLQVGRRAFAYRRMLVCRDLEDAANALETLAPERVVTAAHESRERPVAFMFPGQGAQYVDMALGLYQSEPLFRTVVDQCAELLRPHLGLDIREAIYPDRDKETRRQGDKEAPGLLVSLSPGLEPADPARAPHTESANSGLLDEIWLTLPALFVVDYALAQLWMSWGVYPQALIGYSMGEYVAACLAGVFSLEDALALVATRARLVHGTPAGAMLVVPLPEEELRPLLGPLLDLALINSPALCVVAGPVAAVEELHVRLTARDVKCRRLPVEHAYHSDQMEPIVEALVAEVRKVRLSPPRIPYISNVSGTWITDEQATDTRYWGRHLRQTVRFADGLRTLCETPGRVLLEVGPGRSLVALARLLTELPEPPLVLASMRHPRVEQPDRVALLATAGQLWLAGASLRWPALHDGERRRRVLLPTYPFERQRYWVELRKRADRPADGRRTTVGKKLDIADWFYLPTWRESLPPRPFQPGDLTGRRERWLILADDLGLAAQITRRLEQEGQELIVVRAGAAFSRVSTRDYTIDLRRAEDYAALLDDLRAHGATPDAILHLWSLAPGRRSQREAGPAQVLDRGYYSLLFLAQALDHAGLAGPLRLEVVTSELHALVPSERTRPEQATLLGPCKVIPQEYPQIACRCIDVGSPRTAHQLAALADQLIAEFRADASDAMIIYRGPQRWVQTFQAIRLDDRSERRRALRPGGVYLITGGLGAVGLLLAEHLARSAQARLALLGRTPLPPRERWDGWLAGHPDDDPTSGTIRRLQRIAELGVELLILSADVADEAQMRAAIARTYAHFGTLHGVLHAAGITQGPSILRPLREIGRAESQAQMRPKLDGTRVLERVLRGRVIDFCLLFSSQAAILGGLGFVAYAAANLFLDAFAAQRNRAGDARWISASWDGWLMAETEIAPSAFHSSMDRYAMTRAEGAEAFERVATIAAGHVVVATGDFQARLAQWVSRAPVRDGQALQPSGAALALHPRPSVQTAYASPRTSIEERLVTIWQEQLGIERVGIDDNFFELGGHSLLATQVVVRVRQIFGVELPLRELFIAPTIAGMAEAIVRARAEQQDREELERLLAELDQLSEEETQQLLAQDD